MNLQTIPVRLAIQQIDFQCLFDLTWGSSQKLSALIPFPLSLETQYKKWFHAYLTFYQSLPLEKAQAGLRGQLEPEGNVSRKPQDWQAELVQAEVNFLYHFHRWLRHQDLFEIRSQIAQLARAQESESAGTSVDIFVSAEPAIMARFPWEQWELGAEFGTTVPLRISRCPSQLKESALGRPAQQPQGREFRVLAIMGDEQGLDFEGDREALQGIAPAAKIHFVGWQPHLNSLTLKQDICDAIASPEGWDLLFFAGHSNEKSLTGGEFIISPTQVLSLEQLLPALQTAQANGLQLSIFNSCSGMGIATRLLEMGLSQVVVMREPIHNQVAHAFLQRFLLHLSGQKDAQDALHATCQDLKVSQNVTYPSAYCLPSLFRHPATTPFQFKPRRAGDRLKRLKPSRWEAIVLGGLMVISLVQGVQETLLGSRLWFQAHYRDLTGQLPFSAPSPPITIVQIDEASLAEAKIKQKNPMDRQYLAQIIQRLQESEASIIGIDYLLDIPKPPQPTQALNQSIQAAVKANKTWFVFGSATYQDGVEQKVHPEIASPHWSVSGDSQVYWGHIALPNSLEDCAYRCPMGYLLSLLWLTESTFPNLLPNDPNLLQSKILQETILKEIAQSQSSPDLERLKQQHQLGITQLSALFGQLWFAPIIDFSIPKNSIYSRIPSRALFDPDQNFSFDNAIVFIGSGGYSEAEDRFIQPPAQDHFTDPSLSGVELHAFMVNHLLSRRLVIPIPDGLMILLTALFTKILMQGTIPWGKGSKRMKVGGAQGWMIVFIGLIVSMGICLQLFLSVAILVPWFFPSLTIGLYCIPKLMGEGDAS